MTANLDIEPRLLEKAMRLSGERTVEAAVNRALEEFIARHVPRRLLGLFGKFDWNPDFDYRAERAR